MCGRFGGRGRGGRGDAGGTSAAGRGGHERGGRGPSADLIGEAGAAGAVEKAAEGDAAKAAERDAAADAEGGALSLSLFALRKCSHSTCALSNPKYFSPQMGFQLYNG
eukprot:jgi/Undpi1/11519/HiC_scaffold_30.g13816.m1